MMRERHKINVSIPNIGYRHERGNMISLDPDKCRRAVGFRIAKSSYAFHSSAGLSREKKFVAM